MADVLSYSDYYPFGSQLPGRNASSGDYRYGFNGMEKDDEVKGSGNSYDFGARIYDSRLGRWLAVDPQSSKQPSWSPYKSFNNSPLIFNDPDGQIEYVVTITRNEITGKASLTYYTTDKDKTNGVPKMVMGAWAVETDHEANVYYDFVTLQITTTCSDGSVIVENRTVFLYEEGFVIGGSTLFGVDDAGETMNEHFD